MFTSNVIGLIVDLKLKDTSENGVKILELGEEGQSDFKGFNALPDAAKIRSASALIGETAAHALSDRGELTMSTILRHGKEALEGQAEPGFLYGENRPLDRDFFGNKAVHPSFFTGPTCIVLPAQTTFPSVLNTSQITDISTHLTGYLGDGVNSDNGYVLKLTQMSGGFGILPINHAEIGNFLTQHFLPASQSETGLFNGHAVNDDFTHPSPTFVIQERVPGVPIDTHGKIVAQDSQEPSYDATMRMVFLAWKQEGHVHLARAGEYWKLPKRPISSHSNVLDHETILSDVRDGGSAPVPDPLRDNVYAAISEPVRLALESLSNTIMVEHIEDLVSPNRTEAENILGMHFVLKHLTSLARQDADTALAIVQAITEIPDRFEKQEYAVRLLNGFVQYVAHHELPAQISTYIQDFVAQEAESFVRTNIGDTQQVFNAISVLNRFCMYDAGTLAMGPDDIDYCNEALKQSFPHFTLPKQFAVISALSDGGTELNNSLYVTFAHNMHTALDIQEGQQLLETITLAFWLPTTPCMEENMRSRGVQDAQNALLDHALDATYRLPVGLRAKALEPLYELYNGVDEQGNAKTFPPPPIEDYFLFHPERNVLPTLGMEPVTPYETETLASNGSHAAETASQALESASPDQSAYYPFSPATESNVPPPTRVNLDPQQKGIR